MAEYAPECPTPDEMYQALDPRIAPIVRILRDAGIETYESCQGGPGHSYPEPGVRFYGQSEEGFRAFAAARRNGLHVTALRRIWQVIDGEPTGPNWELVFRLDNPEEAEQRELYTALSEQHQLVLKDLDELVGVVEAVAASGDAVAARTWVAERDAQPEGKEPT